MKWTLFVIIITLFAACSGREVKKEESTQKRFEMINVPITITDPALRADYLVKNYWNKFDFSDTTYIALEEVTEQAFADYINIFNYASPQVVTLSIKDMLKKTEIEHRMFIYFTDLFDKYLYDPNSPARNETYYIPVLEVLLASNQTDEMLKIRYAKLLDLALKNRIGEKAINFNFIEANGKRSNLYNIKADYTLIYFYNPGCIACKQLQFELENSLQIKELLKSKKLKILALYPDEDIAEWEAYKVNIPTQWINAYDKGAVLQEKEMYDLKAIPTLYLLDKDKNVIFKDGKIQVISEYLDKIR